MIHNGTLLPFFSRCVGGSLQFLPGSFDVHSPTPVPLEDPKHLSICEANGRYFPPIVQFQDFYGSSKRPRKATLLFRVDDTTSRSQFLAHYSFTPEDNPDTGLHFKGGTRVTRNQSDNVDKDEEKEEHNQGTKHVRKVGQCLH